MNSNQRTAYLTTRLQDYSTYSTTRLLDYLTKDHLTCLKLNSIPSM
ncbi:MAG: hypothetical protein M5U34_13780 [Chloroflexi bacterium]|nr:hypothetical protein [Chloroflexota bacterium]